MRALRLWLADRLTRGLVVREPDPNHPGWYFYQGPPEAVSRAVLIDAARREGRA